MYRSESGIQSVIVSQSLQITIQQRLESRLRAIDTFHFFHFVKEQPTVKIGGRIELPYAAQASPFRLKNQKQTLSLASDFSLLLQTRFQSNLPARCWWR